MALLGPNGAGKTTTLRAITASKIHEGRITKGDVRWGGESVTAKSAEGIVAQGIAQVMEGRRILAELTAEENLLAGLRCASRSYSRGSRQVLYPVSCFG